MWTHDRKWCHALSVVQHCYKGLGTEVSGRGLFCRRKLIGRWWRFWAGSEQSGILRHTPVQCDSSEHATDNLPQREKHICKTIHPQTSSHKSHWKILKKTVCQSMICVAMWLLRCIFNDLIWGEKTARFNVCFHFLFMQLCFILTLQLQSGKRWFTHTLPCWVSDVRCLSHTHTALHITSIYTQPAQTCGDRTTKGYKTYTHTT